MYCKNCRNKIPDGAAICKVCGARQDVNPYASAQPQQSYAQSGYVQQSYGQPVQTPPSYNPPPYNTPSYVPAPYGAPTQMGYAKDTSIIKICVLVTAIVMLVLSFVSGYTEQYYSESIDYYGYELLEGIFDGEGDFYFFPLIMTAFDLWVIISCLAMVIDQLSRRYNPSSEYNALGGYGYMMSAIIAIALNWLYILYLTNDLAEEGLISDKVEISISTARIGILILALVNRFVFLPTYLSALRYNKNLKEEAHRLEKGASADKSYAPASYASKMPATASKVVTYWRCPKCGEENPTNSPLCKSCGTYK